MKKLLALCSLLFIFSVASAQTHVKVSGVASKGGKVVRVSPSVQYKLMETYPACTVSVYLAGTATLATLYSDEGITLKSNPFTSNSLDASFSFYVVPGRYDLTFSGTGITSPFTIADFFVAVGTGGGGGSVTSFNGRTGVVVPTAGDYTFSGLDFTGSNFNSIATRSASDLSSGTLPDARFPAVLPAISGINLTNLNASNIASGTLSDARLSANVPLKDTVNIFSLQNIFQATVGIGTSGPDRKLDILDPSAAQLRLSAVDGSVYTDLYTDSGGTLNILPTGNTVFDSVGNQVNPLNNYDQNLGQINKKWLSLHAAELVVETLVAQNTIATIGGRILVAPTNQLIADLSSVATTINVKYNNFANGDRVYMEGNSSVEFFAITSGATVISGGFSYTVTRNLDGTGANQWFAGDAMLNTGVAGNGFIDLYSVRGVKSGTQLGPAIVGNIRNSSTYNDWTENWAIGNLNGLYGYGSDTQAVGLGKYATGSQHITIDPTNGIRFFEGLGTITGVWNSSGIVVGEVAAGKSNIQITSGQLNLRNNASTFIRLATDGSGFLANNNIAWDTAGNLSIIGSAVIGGVNIGNGKMYVGVGTYGNSNTAFYIDSAGFFSLEDKLTWDGTTLTIAGNIALSSLTSTLSLSGANSAIAVGITPPTSASAGTGIWLDRTGLYGLNSNVVQAKFASTGEIIAGSGRITLDANRLTIDAPASEISRFRFTSGTGIADHTFLNGSYGLAVFPASGQDGQIALATNNNAFTASTNFSIVTGNAATSTFALLDNLNNITNATEDNLIIRHNSSGTPTTNFGSAILFRLASATVLGRDAARIGTLWTTATDASRTSAITFQTVNNAGSLTELMRVTGDSTIVQSVQWNTGSKPTCNSGNRGKVWYVAGGAGVADTFEVCKKDAADAYAWTALY